MHGDAPLCQTCRYATIVRGPTLGDEIIECASLTYGRGRITFPVTYCTAYSGRRQASIREMEDVAWILPSDPKRNEIGFVRASNCANADRYVLVED
jgi:hypothetical protein